VVIQCGVQSIYHFILHFHKVCNYSVIMTEARKGGLREVLGVA